MAQVLAVAPWAERRRRILELRGRHAFAKEVLDFYGAVVSVQERAFDEALSIRPPAQYLGAYVAEMVVPGVVDVSIACGPAKLREGVAARMDSGDPREIVAAWMGGEEQPVVDRYIARAALSPVLEALGPEAAASCTGTRDRLHCPGCGGPPQLSYFALAGEDLAAGGRFLCCARCHGTWGFPRMTCAGCGESSTSRLSIFSEEGTTSGERGSVVRGLPVGPNGHNGSAPKAIFPHVRIEACDACRRYVLNIDLAADPGAVPIVDELDALPLDLFARERGFSKITPNLMGF